MIIWYGLFLVILVMAVIPGIYGETLKQTVDGGMEISITWPQSVISGEKFSASILVENNGWEDKENIRFGFSADSSLVPMQDYLVIDKIAEGGSYGATIDFDAFSENENTYFFNIDYSHVLVQNNKTPLDPFQTDIAIPIIIKNQPTIDIHTITPESIFANAEFPFEIEILSQDIDLYDLRVRIIPPKDIEFRGETLHTFSNVKKENMIKVRSEIITPQKEISSHFNVPFEVIITYKDHLGQEKTESKTIPLVLRPRTFMEITTEGGIWIGSFFIAPYVSLGTIIGIPAGAVISVMINRSKKSKRKRKTKQS